LKAIPAELLVWRGEVHRQVRAGDRAFDGSLDVLLQGVGRSAADEDVEGDFGVVEPMESDGISEAPRDDRAEERKTCLVNVGRGDVPASKSAFPFKALASPQAARLGLEPRFHALGLSVGLEA